MNDKMSQDDIDKLLNNPGGEEAPGGEELSREDLDTVGEVANIFMGSASTTLSQLLNNKVEITTPEVEIFQNIQESYVVKEDHLIIEITYKEGLQGTVVLALKKTDSAVIADLMMGGSGKVDGLEIGELQISAVGEAMNQMVGTASTTLSGMLSTPIDITPPEVKLLEKDKKMELGAELITKPIVCTKFNLKIGDLIDSEIIQFMSIESARAQVDEVTKMMKAMSEGLKEGNTSESIVEGLASELEEQKKPSHVNHQTPPPPPSQLQYHAPPPPPPREQPQGSVTVQPVQFSSFDNTSSLLADANKNLNLVMDVKLELTVELGRTDLSIKNVLALTRGSIIELDKVAGEPVDLYANGKLIAKGEVVVIEDNFGLRITSIISPEQRIQEL